MGFFDKIKNILFEEDDEVDEMPVYTKENIENKDKEINNSQNSQATELDDVRYTSIKRDIDVNFDEIDNKMEITNTLDIPRAKLEKQEENKDKEIIEEKKSPFLSFDEDEFERLNSRININEKKIKKVEKPTPMPKEEPEVKIDVRKANNNFSSVNTHEEKNNLDKDRYKIKNEDKEKKPFTPSPVISPVYGILNKNYKKDEIVDKKDGIKREKLVKDVHHAKTIEVARKDEYGVYKVDIDSVRKKAFGGLDNLEKNANLDRLRNEEENITNESTLIKLDEIVESDLPKKNDSLSVEDELDEKKYEEIKNDKLSSDVKDYSSSAESNDKQDLKAKPKALDEMEKTSTLQILDDIEKELNSIKPYVSSTEKDEDTDSSIENSDTMENDLFNLIDSMYENDGEEEEDD